MAFSMAMDWSEGESKMHSLLHVPPQDNPTSAMLTPQASLMLQRAPLLAIGTLDNELRPWTALWGGDPGFSEPIGGGFVGTRTLVDSKHDPVVQALVGGAQRGEMLQPQGEGKMLSGLAIDLVTRKRVKIAGAMAAGGLRSVDIEIEEGDYLPADAPRKQDQIQLVTKISQSLGNCPKYLNQYALRPALLTPTLLHSGPSLSSEGNNLIEKADMFFLSTSSGVDMDTNHRGGPPGFIRIVSSTCIVYPEYSGNRLYQSLGNLKINPRIGVTVPDFENGDVLYATGTAEILVGADAEKVMPGTNLAVKIDLTDTRYVRQGLAFRGELQINGHSPYNPRLRPLASEGNIKSALSTSSSQIARLVGKGMLTRDIARFTFSVAGGIRYKPGQWVALSFKDDLDIGYSHMRNDDPQSLNDDFVRTFTISSTPKAFTSGNGDGVESENTFEITIRRVGPVTSYLFAQNARAGFEVPVLGIGGEFGIKQEEGGLTPFIAGGVGITPLLGSLPDLGLQSERFKLLWAVKTADVGLVLDTFARHPRLAGCTSVFVTGSTTDASKENWDKVASAGASVAFRRLAKADLEEIEAERWYLCAGKAFRKQVLLWLEGKEVLFEDFDY